MRACGLGERLHLPSVPLRDLLSAFSAGGIGIADHLVAHCPHFSPQQSQTTGPVQSEARKDDGLTMTITNGAILERHQINTGGIEHLDLEVPILTGPQAQGDVLILPVPLRAGGDPITPKGVTVVAGETTGGNAHILHALDGECFWSPAPNAAVELVQGWLTVPDGSSATMVHTQEHSVIGIGPGCFEVRRQREFAGEWARVTD